MDHSEEISTIVSVKAVEVKNSKFQIIGIKADGSEVVLKKKGNLPENVFFYNWSGINGNASGEIGGHCTFGKNVSSPYKSCFVRSLPVIVD